MDAPRSGFPGIFTPEQILEIIAIACEQPGPTHRIRFVYTPKRASFTGVEQLNERVLAFIDFLTKPWPSPSKAYTGRPLVV